MSEVSTFRLYLMRALYLLMFLGQVVMQWPTILHHTNALPLWHGVGSSMLFAIQIDAQMAEAIKATFMGVIVPIVIPWPNVCANYVKKPGDRWR